MKLNRNFYLKPTLEVAESLISKFLVHRTKNNLYQAEITETEGYIGKDDQACHGSRGRSKSNKNMFKAGGISYVYLIYGIYHMLNIVTEKAGKPSAVLIRGLDCQSCDGPGKLTKKFKISKEKHNGIDLTADILWLEDRGKKPKVKRGKRIGVDYAGKWAEKPWRFYNPN
jgi:DNA-3-methyladenine glycosylase